MRVFANPAGNSKGLGEKWKIQTGGGVNDYGIPRAWRSNAFWNFRRQGGLKYVSPLSVGTDFSGIAHWPNLITCVHVPLHVQ